MKTRVLTFLTVTAATATAQQNAVVLADLQGSPGEGSSWPVSLKGTSPVVGMQFDLNYAAGQLSVVSHGAPAQGGAIALTAAREIEPGKTRVVVSSANNEPLPKGVVLDTTALTAESAPSGGPSYTVSNIIFALADGSRVNAVRVEYGPVTTWKMQHFTAAELSAGLIIGDFADPDGDGTFNLLEYGVGGDPRRALPGENPLPEIATLVEEGQSRQYLTLNYRQAISASGVLLQPQVSTDLLLWFAGANPIATGAGDGNSIPMQARVPMDAAASQFLRLKVSRQPE